LATTALDLDEKVRALDDEVLAAGRAFPEVKRFQ
jgi:hypothetical protein